MESNQCMDATKKLINTNIDPFIPKCEMKQQIVLVSDFLFLLFYVNSNKQNILVNYNRIKKIRKEKQIN